MFCFYLMSDHLGPISIGYSLTTLLNYSTNTYQLINCHLRRTVVDTRKYNSAQDRLGSCLPGENFIDVMVIKKEKQQQEQKY